LKRGWSYLPHTPEARRAMLETIGVATAADLFRDIPVRLRLRRGLRLPEALTEPELRRRLQKLAAANANTEEYCCFLGAGAYDHYIPSVVDEVLRRAEFYTAYTQYQAEISQGYLQALWEYQSLICLITGMEVANASLYDGGVAVAEAAMMACNVARRTDIVVARTVHPHYRSVLKTYLKDRNYQLQTVDFDDGVTEPGRLAVVANQNTAAVVIQSPNFFGAVEDIRQAAAIVHARGAYLIVCADPLSLGVLEAPGRLGADIVVGEGQPLGTPLTFGGPYLGYLATTAKLTRKMPGRIIGQTTDKQGNRGFVLTLQAREQHIRRDKATSNICSNEALCALAAAVYLNAVGKKGLPEVAGQCLQKAYYAYNTLTGIAGCEAVFGAPFYKEFAVRLGKPVAAVNQALLRKGIIGGLNLEKYFPELTGCMLLCVTEKRSKNEIDRLAREMEAILCGGSSR
jgi:glycine dehydrogenase subunit 1